MKTRVLTQGQASKTLLPPKEFLSSALLTSRKFVFSPTIHKSIYPPDSNAVLTSRRCVKLESFITEIPEFFDEEVFQKTTICTFAIGFLSPKVALAVAHTLTLVGRLVQYRRELQLDLLEAEAYSVHTSHRHDNIHSTRVES